MENFLNTQNDKFRVLIGATLQGFPLQQIESIWLAAASVIVHMYSVRVKSRKGIG